MEDLGFFKKLKCVDTTRDYTIIVDKSGSMYGDHWRDAKEAVAQLATEAVKVHAKLITMAPQFF